MQPAPIFRWALVAVVSLATPASWGAANLGVSPLRIVIPANATSASIQLVNNGDQEVVLQSQLMHWGQSNGEDQLSATDEILVSPPIFKIPGGGKQTIRVGLLRRREAASEMTYRLFLQEIPAPLRKDQTQSGVPVALRLSLPIFVQPPARATPTLLWQASVDSSGGLRLSLTNTGNAHTRAPQIAIREGTLEIVAPRQLEGYVLAGQSRTWKLEANRAVAGGTVELRVKTDAGETASPLELRSE